MILLLCLVLLGASAGAQPCDQPWCAYTSMKQIEGVLLDSSSLWAATTGGVLRYDRGERRYDRFTRADGLAGNRILSLAADGEGDLWFGSDGRGLSRYRTATGRFDPPYQEFRGLAITSLLSVGNRLFVGTSGGISLFLVDREEVKETYRLLGDLPKDTAALQMVLLDGKLYVATSQGVAWARLDQPNLQDPESWRSLPLESVGGLVAVEGNLYLTGQRSIYAYDPGDDTFRPDYLERVLSLGARGGQVVAATRDGRLVARNEEGVWSVIPAPRIEGITSISTSEEEVLWLGTSSGLRVIGDPAAVLPSEPGSSRFYEIVVTGEEELWAASVPNDRHAGCRRLPLLAGPLVGPRSQYNVVAFETDAEGRLWTGSWGSGAWILEASGGWTRIPTSQTVLRPSSSNNPRFVLVSDIHRDRAGHMWLLNSLVGVAVLDGYPPEREFLFDQQDLGIHPSLVLSRMDIGPDGLKWMVGTRSGLVLLDDGGTPFSGGDDRMIGLSQADDSRLTSDRLFDVLAARDGRVWLAAENGLNVLTPEYDRAAGTLAIPDWQTYTTSDGLPSDVINALEEDDGGNVWVGTEAGLVRIVAGGRVDPPFTKRNSQLIDDRVKGLRYDSDRGELWIGTLDGLSRLRLSSEDGPPPEASRVFPNPFVRTGGRELTFTGLPLGAGLRIYSASGDLVADLRGDAGLGTVTWDGQNNAGYLVASGIYYYLAEGESGESVSGRFALVNGGRR